MIPFRTSGSSPDVYTEGRFPNSVALCEVPLQERERFFYEQGPVLGEAEVAPRPDGQLDGDPAATKVLVLSERLITKDVLPTTK